MAADQSQANTGMFVPETNVWEISQLRDINVNTPEFKELLVRLYQNINNIAIALNQKETGVYPLAEMVNSQAWFPNPATSATTPRQPQYRGDYRIVINMGALPNAGTITIPHFLTPTPNWTFTHIYGTASDTTGLNYIPIPYASPVLANNIELSVDSTNVTITTGSNRSNFNVTLVVLEYLKN
jgi:hypothetical protein